MLLATLGFVVGTFRVRVPYWGEAEVLFEASRVRQGAPLFLDPLVGTSDAPPSRYYVTYPPLVSWLLSWVPAAWALLVGRALACVAWFGALAWAVCRAASSSRGVAGLAAAYVGGSWVLGNFAMTARPDALACALLAFALLRVTAHARVDALTIVLLCAAPLVKPTLIGAPLGVLLVCMMQRDVRAWLWAFGTTAVGFAMYAWLGDVRWWQHVLLSNAQPLAFSAWWEHVPPRLPFFLPLLALAWWSGWRARAQPGAALLLGALAGSTLLCMVTLAKIGSSSNYWMEPCLCAVILLAKVPPAFERASWRAALAASIVVVYAASASIPAAWSALHAYRDEAAFVASARARCDAAVGEVIGADAQGIELALDDRILIPAYQTAWLVRSGRFPASTWIADLEHPALRGYLLGAHALDVAPAIRDAVERNFPRVVATEQGMTLRCR